MFVVFGLCLVELVEALGENLGCSEPKRAGHSLVRSRGVRVDGRRVACITRKPLEGFDAVLAFPISELNLSSVVSLLVVGSGSFVWWLVAFFLWWMVRGLLCVFVVLVRWLVGGGGSLCERGNLSHAQSGLATSQPVCFLYIYIYSQYTFTHIHKHMYT